MLYDELQSLVDEQSRSQDDLRKLADVQRGITEKLGQLRDRYYQEVIRPTCDTQTLYFSGEAFFNFMVQDTYNGVREVRHDLTKKVSPQGVDMKELKAFISRFSFRAYEPSKVTLVMDTKTRRYSVQVPETEETEGNASTQGQNGNTPSIP